MDNVQLHSESELLQLVADGDENAFREIFRRYTSLLFPFFVKLTHSSHAAEELIQETMLRFWQHRQKLPFLENPRSWLFKIGANRAYTWMSTEARRQNNVFLEPDFIDTEVYSGIQAKQLHEEISLAVMELPARRKLIYRLSRDRHMKVSEIADHLGLSVSTVKNTLAAALSTIWKRLQKTGHIIPLLVVLGCVCIGGSVLGSNYILLC